MRADQVLKLLNGWAFAESQRTPLDLHVVVHWERLGLIAGKSILAAQAAFLDRLSKWMFKRNKPLAYLWTVEFSPRYGHHTHLLLSGKQLHATALGDLARSLSKLLTGNDRKLPHGVVELATNKTPLPYDPGRSGYRALTYEQRRGQMAYICKGLHPTAAVQVGINAECQGEVRFRRCGLSRSLDWTARQQAGWAEQALNQFDFSALAEKRRASLARRRQRRPGAPGSPQHLQTVFPQAGLPRGSTGLGGAPTGPAGA